MKRKNEILEQEVKDRESDLREQIELYKMKAKGKLPDQEIARVLEEISAMRTDDESSDSESNSDNN